MSTPRWVWSSRALSTRRRTAWLGSPGAPGQLVGIHTPEEHPYIKAVQQGTGEAAAVALRRGGRASALSHSVVRPAARTGIGSRNHQRPTGKSSRHPLAGDSHSPLFQRLAKRVDEVGRELSQLVKKQHTVVSQGDIPRRRNPATAAQEPRYRGSVMGSAERPDQDRPATVGGRPHTGHLHLLGPVKRGSIPGSRLASIVFPIPGGPDMSKW